MGAIQSSKLNLEDMGKYNEEKIMAINCKIVF